MPNGRSSGSKGGVYQRGEFWLDHVRRAGGAPASSRLYIWWYDRDGGRLQRKSTGESDVRLASDKLDEHYLSAHRPDARDQESYTVSECLADYWLEHGSRRASSDSIKARLKLLTRFVDHEVDEGRLSDPFLPADVDDRFVQRFRAWATADPIVARRKGADGEWLPGAARARKASTAEESVIQLKAALQHAFKARRVKYVPPLRHLTRNAVTPERTYRLSIDGLAELLDYSARGAGSYAGHADRLVPLRRFLIGAIATLARPDAVLDMSVAAERGQWARDDRRFALNPAGRVQTKKVRPIMPVVDALHQWLLATDEWFVCKQVLRTIDDEEVVTQTRVASVRSGWDGAKARLRIHEGWGPKLVRHSMSTILANAGVDLVQLEVALGHRAMSRTTSRYAHLDPGYLKTVAAGIEHVMSELLRKTGTALDAPSPAPVRS